MNIQRIKTLAWMGALLTGGLLGWEVADFVQNRAELEKTVSMADMERVLREEVTEPEPPKVDLVDAGAITTYFHEMPWTGGPPPKQVEDEPAPVAPTVRATPVADLLTVLAVQEDRSDPERSMAYVKFLDPELLRLRREPRLQILRNEERLGGAHEHVRVFSIDVDGVTFAFDDPEREHETLTTLDYSAIGPGIVRVTDAKARTNTPIPRNPYVQFDRTRTEAIRRDTYQVGTDDVEDLNRNYSQILSRDLRYRTARDPGGQVIGIQITKVEPNSLPARAGLQPGEILKSINGRPVRSVSEAVAYVKQVADTTNTWVAVFEKQGAEYTRTYTSPPSQ